MADVQRRLGLLGDIQDFLQGGRAAWRVLRAESGVSQVHIHCGAGRLRGGFEDASDFIFSRCRRVEQRHTDADRATSQALSNERDHLVDFFW